MHCRNTLETIEIPAQTSIALGYFDGVHLGHRAVIESAVQDARENQRAAAVFTFAPPQCGGIKGKSILTQTEKRRRMQQLGVEYYICPPFEEFCGLSPQQFVQDVLVRRLCARTVFCGADFTFGKDKAGDVALLRRLCGECGVQVHELALVQRDADVVSSSRIRECLEHGEMQQANAMLGQAYCIDLPVQHGQKLGTTLGFPTINQIYPQGMLLPQQGVYITRVRIDGAWYPSATGLGTRPTVNGTGITCETFIPDFSGDVYGDTICVEFCRYLWPTQKFDSLQALSDMVQRAAKAAKQWHAQTQPR